MEAGMALPGGSTWTGPHLLQAGRQVAQPVLFILGLASEAPESGSG